MERLADYLDFARKNPEYFVNPSEGGFIIFLEEDDIHKVEAHMAQRLEAKGLPVEWAQVGIAYEDQYGMILRDAIRFPGGALGTYIRFVPKPNNASSVIIFPLYQTQVILVHQFHHATRTWHLELPQIMRMKGLAGEEDVISELVEKIGASASRIVFITKLAEGPGLVSSSADIYYAETEFLGNTDKRASTSEVLLVSVSEFERMIRDSEITDAFTIIAYLHMKLQGLI